MGCTCPCASMTGCSSEPWNGSSSVPSVVVPSGKIAMVSPAASDIARTVVDAMRVAPPLALDEKRARIRRSCRPTSGQRLSSDLAMKRAGCRRVEHEDIEPRDVVGDDQQVAGQPLGGQPRDPRFDAHASAAAASLQRRISACRLGSPTSGKTNAVVAMPWNTCRLTRACRYTRSGSGVRSRAQVDAGRPRACEQGESRSDRLRRCNESRHLTRDARRSARVVRRQRVAIDDVILAAARARS